MKKLAFLTSKSGGMIQKLQAENLRGDVYSNRKNTKLEQRVKPIYFSSLGEIPNNYDFYVLCGFMNIIPEKWLTDKKVINYHPGTPNYKGIDPQIKMLQDYKKGKIKYAGGFIHFVDGGVDTGELIYGFYSKIQPNDNVQILTERLEKKAVKFLGQYLK